MSQTKLKGAPVRLLGKIPSLHDMAPDFVLVDQDLNNRSLSDYKGKRKLLAVVPSLDTGVCSLMTKHLNSFAKNHPHNLILVISADLPFAQKRFCGTEGVHNIVTLSMMRGKEFGKAYGLLIEDGPLAGVLARALIILDEKDRVVYTQLVDEITHEPDYHKALQILQK